MIEVQNLTKKYKDKKAVDDISFTVNDGEILGFLGPNGAGKTTTMNIITGYTSSTAGTVRVNGAEILDEPMKVKTQIGYLPERPPLYPEMSVDEYLSFVYDLKKVKNADGKKKHIGQVCSLVKIDDVQKRIIRNLSKGYQQRVGLAQALIGEPQVLIFDEPTVGLDPKQIIEMRGLIKQLGKKYTVILSSHILSEVQAVCERVIVINEGRLIADGTPDKLSHEMSGDDSIIVRVEGPKDAVTAALRGLPGLGRLDYLGPCEANAHEYMLKAKVGKDLRRELCRQMAGEDWPILELRASGMSLEDIFIRLIAGIPDKVVTSSRKNAEVTGRKKGERGGEK